MSEEDPRGVNPWQENPEWVAEWDVYRDEHGRPVTITVEQSRAIWHAIRVADAVREKETGESFWQDGSVQAQANLGKSRLLGRMLFEGKPPTKTSPPMADGGPAWWMMEGGDPFGD